VFSIKQNLPKILFPPTNHLLSREILVIIQSITREVIFRQKKWWVIWLLPAGRPLGQLKGTAMPSRANRICSKFCTTYGRLLD